MILGAMVEMEGYFFILFLTAAFFCGILFIGYFEQVNGISCKITSNFIMSDSNIEEVSVVKSEGHIILNQNAIDETARIQKLIDDGNVKLYPIKNVYKDLN